MVPLSNTNFVSWQVDQVGVKVYFIHRKHKLVDVTTDPVVALFLWELCLLGQNHSCKSLIIPSYEGSLPMTKSL